MCSEKEIVYSNTTGSHIEQKAPSLSQILSDKGELTIELGSTLMCLVHAVLKNFSVSHRQNLIYYEIHL